MDHTFLPFARWYSRNGVRFRRSDLRLVPGQLTMGFITERLPVQISRIIS